MQEPKFYKRFTSFAVTYGVWMLISLSLLGLFFLVRDAVLQTLLHVKLNPWVYKSIDNWGTLSLGLIAFIAIVGLESFYRDGVNKKRFWRRVSITLLIEGVVAIISWGVVILL